MRVAFAGTPEFAATVLGGILSSKHKVGLVISQPDAQRGRGRRLVPPPVAGLARSSGIELLQPARIEEVESEISGCDALVVAAYGQILRPSVLDAAAHGAWNVHASLLPKYRGAAPVERAIMAGKSESGVSIMRMEEGLDTGPVALQRKVGIPSEMIGGELLESLAHLGAESIVKALDLLEKERLTTTSQDNGLATYAPPISPQERLIDWAHDARAVHDRIRALSPHIVARTFHPRIGGPVKLLRSRVPQDSLSLSPGEISTGKNRILVGCSDGEIEVLELQISGGKPLATEDFLRGHDLEGSFYPEPLL